MKFFKHLQRQRKLACVVLVLSTLLFILVSALWSAGAAQLSTVSAVLCPVLLLLALFGQLSALLALLQKPRA